MRDWFVYLLEAGERFAMFRFKTEQEAEEWGDDHLFAGTAGGYEVEHRPEPTEMSPFIK